MDLEFYLHSYRIGYIFIYGELFHIWIVSTSFLSLSRTKTQNEASLRCESDFMYLVLECRAIPAYVSMKFFATSRIAATGIHLKLCGFHSEDIRVRRWTQNNLFTR